MAAITHQIYPQINNSKTKYTVNRHDENKIKVIELMGNKIRKSRIFKYLGLVMTSIKDIEIEIKSETTVGNKCYYALGPLLRRKSISQ